MTTFLLRISCLLWLQSLASSFLLNPISLPSSTRLHTFSTSEDEEDEERLSDEDLLATLSPWDPTVPRFNTIHLTGRVGNDPNPKYLEDGKVVVNLSLATTRKYHSMERQQLNVAFGEEPTDWFGLEIW